MKYSIFLFVLISFNTLSQRKDITLKKLDSLEKVNKQLSDEIKVLKKIPRPLIKNEKITYQLTLMIGEGNDIKFEILNNDGRWIKPSDQGIGIDFDYSDERSNLDFSARNFHLESKNDYLEVKKNKYNPCRVDIGVIVNKKEEELLFRISAKSPQKTCINFYEGSPDKCVHPVGNKIVLSLKNK